jgi:hypothetical protein
MVRRLKATQIESVVTPSGNSGHVIVPKAWIGKLIEELNMADNLSNNTLSGKILLIFSRFI